MSHGLQDGPGSAGPSRQTYESTYHGSGDQINSSGGVQNISKGDDFHMNGATFHQPVYLGRSENADSRETCLKSLAFPEMNNRALDIHDAAEGTCRWLLEHPEYTSWTADSAGGLLWIKGKPGSGKSTLFRHALDNIEGDPHFDRDDLVLSFFYHGRGTELQRTPAGLYRSLLHQLRHVEGALADAVKTCAERCETLGAPGVGWNWHPRELQQLFGGAIRKALKSCAIWLFIDALDESGEENAVAVMDTIKSLAADCKTNGTDNPLYICFTCRHYPNLPVHEGEHQIHVEVENNRDIETFVHGSLSTILSTAKADVLDIVMERANGVFLWAWLAVKRIQEQQRRGATLEELTKDILAVPKELNSVYRQLVEQMGADSLKLMQWVCFAMVPLTLEQWSWAALVDAGRPNEPMVEAELPNGDLIPDEETALIRLQALSCGLVEVASGDDDTIQFIHQSTRDFFLDEGLSTLAKALDPAEEATTRDEVAAKAHYRLSRSCIRHVFTKAHVELSLAEWLMDDLSLDLQITRIRLRCTFVFYSAAWWAVHARQCEQGRTRGRNEDLLEYFGWPSEKMTLKYKRIRIEVRLGDGGDDRIFDNAGLLHIAANFQLMEPLREMLRRGSESKIGVLSQDERGRTPLHHAAGAGHEDAARLLLDSEKRDRRRTLLRHLFRDKGGQINIVDQVGRTAVFLAANAGYTGMVRLLLESGADPSLGSEPGDVPLWPAIHRCRVETLQLLLEYGAKLNVAADWAGDTSGPLQWAVETGNAAVTRLVLRRGVDPNVVGGTGKSVLEIAVWGGRVDVMQALLDHGADANYCGPRQRSRRNEGLTPLMVAARAWEPRVARLLLDHGAKVDACDDDGRPTLWYGLQSSQGRYTSEAELDMVELLLDRGFPLDLRDREGRVAIHWATTRGSIPILELIIQRGADINCCDHQGRTPLSIAATRWGSLDVAKLLIEKGADIDLGDIDGRTPASYAAGWGNVEMLQALLAGGAELDSRDCRGLTPLAHAACEGNATAVDFLVSAGAALDGTDSRGRTALSQAAGARRIEVAYRLLKAGASIDIRDDQGRTALCHAVTKNIPGDMARILLDHGADVDIPDHRGRTPLSLAVESNEYRWASLPMVTALLNGGARPDCADETGWTPMDWALAKGQDDILQHMRRRAPTTGLDCVD